MYAVALMSGKSALVEGALIGSVMAGVLLMPGCSMISGGIKRKEQKFNAKSAGKSMKHKGLSKRIKKKEEIKTLTRCYYFCVQR